MNLSPSLGSGSGQPLGAVEVAPRIEVRSLKQQRVRLSTGPVMRVRNLPTVKRIAAALLADPAILNMRARALQYDICDRFDVCRATAMSAIGMARANNIGDSRGTQA